MAKSIAEICYPELEMGGFTRCDGTVAFYTRVQALLEPDAAVLEVGCGRGQFGQDSCRYRRELRTFKGRCRRVIGIDVDPAASVNPFLDEFRLIENTQKWPVEDASVQLIVSDYVLEHVPNPERFFSEIRRVLAPGGYVCIRTVNTWSYIALASRLIPNRLHRKTLETVQKGREAQDVFPTVYRCNTRRRILRMLRSNGMSAAVYRVEPEPAYFSFSRLAYRIAAFAHARMPHWCRSTLLVYGRRPD